MTWYWLDRALPPSHHTATRSCGISFGDATPNQRRTAECHARPPRQRSVMHVRACPDCRSGEKYHQPMSGRIVAGGPLEASVIGYWWSTERRRPQLSCSVRGNENLETVRWMCPRGKSQLAVPRIRTDAFIKLLALDCTSNVISLNSFSNEFVRCNLEWP